jgi:peroxiredoxin Q/BCP
MSIAAGPEVGDAAPDFARPAANGELIRLSDFRDRQHVVLYFYPRDHTAICTAQACEFRDRYADFLAADAVVIGISGNSLPSHRQFAEAHALPFALLSDADGSLDSSESHVCDRQKRDHPDGLLFVVARTDS